MAQPKLIISAGVKYDGKGLNKARKDVHKFGRDVRNLSKLFGVALGTGAILNFAKKSIDAFAKEELAAKRLAGVLENTGNAFAVMGVEKSLRSMELLTGETGDLRAAFTQLYLILKDVGAATSALQIAQDVSAGTGIDILSISTALAKAYKGETKNLKALIPSLSAATLASEDSFAITEELVKLYGGAGARNATTFTGKLKILTKGFEEAKKSIGKGLVDSLMLATGSADVEALQKKIIDFGEKAGKAIADLGKVFSDNFELFKSAAIAIASIFVLDKVMIFATVAVAAMTKVSKAMRILRGTAVGTAIATMAVLNPLGAVAYAAALVALIYGAVKAMDALTASSTNANTASKWIFGQNSVTKTYQAAQKQKALDTKALKEKLALLALELKAKTNLSKLDKANKAFDLNAIQINAALRFGIDEDTRLRLLTQKAILENEGAEALRLLGSLKENDAKTKELAHLLATLPKADDPFADWPATIAKINGLLRDLKIPGSAAGLLGMQGLAVTPEGKVIATPTPTPTPKPVIVAPIPVVLTDPSGPTPAQIQAETDFNTFLDAVSAGGDAGFAGAARRAGNPDPMGTNVYVTVNAGVVGSEQVIADAVQTVIQNLGRYGTSLQYAGAIAI